MKDIENAMSIIIYKNIQGFLPEQRKLGVLLPTMVLFLFRKYLLKISQPDISSYKELQTKYIHFKTFSQASFQPHKHIN